MNNLLYIMAVVLLTLWMIGVFIYALGTVIHVLLVMSLIAVLLLARRTDKAV